MKTCKYGCGGKMKESGKVATIKKMKVGGTSGCPPGKCKEWNPEHTSYACNPCPSVQAFRGVLSGAITAATNALTSKMGKNREANKEIKDMVKGIVKKAKSTKIMRKGGSTKGSSNASMGIYGIPQENMGTSSQYTPVAKKGGAVKKAKLAAMAPPKGKITRADIITAAKRNTKKKK